MTGDVVLGMDLTPAEAWEIAARREVFFKARFVDGGSSEFTRLMNNYRAACRALEREVQSARATEDPEPQPTIRTAPPSNLPELDLEIEHGR